MESLQNQDSGYKVVHHSPRKGIITIISTISAYSAEDEIHTKEYPLPSSTTTDFAYLWKLPCSSREEDPQRASEAVVTNRDLLCCERVFFGSTHSEIQEIAAICPFRCLQRPNSRHIVNVLTSLSNHPSWPLGIVVSYPFVLSIDLPDLLIRLHWISLPVLFLHWLLLQWWLLLYHPLCVVQYILSSTHRTS